MIDLRKSLELYHGEKKMEKYKREIKKQGGEREKAQNAYSQNSRR